MKYFFAASALILMACSALKPAAQIKQGLAGHIYSQNGNQMPAPNRPVRKPKGINTDLYIYELTTFKQAEGNNPLFTKINTKLIAKLHTDSTGHYAIGLPAGKYSVFIKTGNEFYANESNTDGVINPVEVIKGKVTTKDWKLARNAVY